MYTMRQVQICACVRSILERHEDWNDRDDDKHGASRRYRESMEMNWKDSISVMKLREE